jgi:hypothetical protein
MHLEKAIELSCLTHTWLIDIDGTIFTHNPHLSGGEGELLSGDSYDFAVHPEDTLLPGVAEFWSKLPPEDFVILLSARHPRYRSMTESALRKYRLRYDHIIFGLPKGERILLNDAKPGGLLTAHAVNLQRDVGLSGLSFTTNPKL